MKWHICYHPTLVLKTPSCFRHMLHFLCEVETLKTEKTEIYGRNGPSKALGCFSRGYQAKICGWQDKRSVIYRDSVFLWQQTFLRFRRITVAFIFMRGVVLFIVYLD